MSNEGGCGAGGYSGVSALRHCRRVQRGGSGAAAGISARSPGASQGSLWCRRLKRCPTVAVLTRLLNKSSRVGATEEGGPCILTVTSAVKP